MPNSNWSILSSLQIGRYAEYYAKMEVASYGFEVYTSEVDDHGIDFIAKSKSGRYSEFQVKSLRKPGYVFMVRTKWNINNPNLYLILLLFYDCELPHAYLIPATAWNTTNELFCNRDYAKLRSKPEYGLNLSKRNMHLLDPYIMDVAIKQL